MFRRPSLRASVTTLAAAAVLVGGADLASYAATGHPLILGHANSAVGSTSLKNLGRGPALSLNSAKSSPPLVVNSSKMVKHLNANMTGGKTGAQLEPNTLRYRLGQDGGTLTSDAHFFSTKLPAGTYQVQMSGILTSSVATDQYICAVGDRQKVLANDITGLYTYAVAPYSAPVISDVYTTKISKNRPVLFGCNTSGTGTVTVAKAVQFTFRAISVKDKKGTPITIGPKHGPIKKLLGR
jgi:hypothetical protein